MYIMFLDVTHQHSDKKWVPQSRSPKLFFAGLPHRTAHPAKKWQLELSLRQPTPLTRALAVTRFLSFANECFSLSSHQKSRDENLR